MNNKIPDLRSGNKVAVLRIDLRTWEGMNPQQQLLFTMQQMLGFMASPMFTDMEGVALHVCDPAFGIKPKIIAMQIGKEPVVLN